VIAEGRVDRRVAFACDRSGRIAAWRPASDQPPGAQILGVVAPGLANAHSHAFHRLLRGRTHGGAGDFWGWRETMYRAADSLDPDGYRALAVKVYAEMAHAGYTAVGEFHYLHHRPGGAAYSDNAMEMALAGAAREVGIRLVLLDTCYLTGGIGRPLAGSQMRFGDGDVDAWLIRWHHLAGALYGDASPAGWASATVSGQPVASAHPASIAVSPPSDTPSNGLPVRSFAATPQVASHLVTLGAAVHSVRAVPPEALAEIALGLPPDIPVHAHLSEQPAENSAILAAYGLTPAALLDEAGLVSSRLAAVHATHVTPSDIDRLGDAGATAVFCPTTEADLGDGIGPARALLDSGVRLAIGSDQHAVIDPFAELRALETSQRLATGRRGILTPAELWRAGQADGYRCLGLAAPLTLGGPCDFVELDADSPRTWGAGPDQLLFAASGADVCRTVVAGRQIAGPVFEEAP
jgi:cytosine/adenosine deaminase-related metal-dependent hydrolase